MRVDELREALQGVPDWYEVYAEGVPINKAGIGKTGYPAEENNFCLAVDLQPVHDARCNRCDYVDPTDYVHREDCDEEKATLEKELRECNRLREAENRINSELITRGRKHGIFLKEAEQEEAAKRSCQTCIEPADICILMSSCKRYPEDNLRFWRQKP